MLHIFVREPLAPRTLRQPYITPSRSAGLCLSSSFTVWNCGVWRREAGGGGRRFDTSIRTGFGDCVGRLVAATMEDVVELWDRISAFDADGHAALLAW